MEVADGASPNSYVYVNGLPYTSPYLQQVEMTGNYIMTQLLTVLANHLKL